MFCLLPGVTKVTSAENSVTVRRDEVDDSGTESTTVAPPAGALLWANDGARWDSRLGSEEAQDLVVG